MARRLPVAVLKQVWTGDVTYVWTLEGWLYLAVLLDLYSRRVVSWAMSQRLTGELTKQALTMALESELPRRASSIIQVVGDSMPP